MHRARVLICEDEGLTTLRLRATLGRLGYDVLGAARDGREVVAVAARLQPDAILMDIDMPNMDGIAATRSIMEDHPTTIVIVSAYGDRRTLSEALDAGASGYLVKPVTDDHLEPAISAAIQRFAGRARSAREAQ